MKSKLGGEGMKSLKYLLLAVLLVFAVSVFAQSGPTYFYVATTVDVNGFESAFSNQTSCTFAQGQKTCNLSWGIPVVPAGGAAIAGFNIYRSKTTGGPYTKITGTLLSATAVAYPDGFVLPNAPILAATPQ
jgi:hypothetical protein